MVIWQGRNATPRGGRRGGGGGTYRDEEGIRRRRGEWFDFHHEDHNGNDEYRNL